MSAMVSDRLDMKVQIANLYYRQNLSQQEIAREMNISRTTVSRILKSCIDEGIVTIHIKNTSMYQYELENKLEKKYGLKHVSVVSNQEDSDLILKAIAASTSEYLSNVITQDVCIGISSGTTIAGIIYHLNPIDNHNVDVYQMLGDASHQTSSCSSFLTIDLAKILRGVPHAMHVPLLVHTKVLRDLLLEEPLNKRHFQRLANLDIAIVGLGDVNAMLPDISDTWYNFTEDKEALREKNVVGDICGVFIDNEGKICDTSIQDRTIAIPLEQLKRIPHCIAVAFGRKKRYIAKAAIKGGYVKVMMIDEELACALLEDD